MQRLVRWKSTLTFVAALGLASLATVPLSAKPVPGRRPAGFRLFAGAFSIFRGNKVECGVKANGSACIGASSQVGGGFWPTGSPNQYVFATGLQLAGKISASVPNPQLAGQVEGALFYDNAAGDGTDAEGITNLFNSADPNDLANWPAIANVPADTIYDPNSFGAKTISDNDVWYLAWEGNPALNGSRNHPLGIAVEGRGLAYTSPDKSDFIFFIYNFFNITSTDTTVFDSLRFGSGGAGPRPEMADTLQSLARRFQALNNATSFGPYPANGYSIDSLFVAFDADMDVTFENSGNNYAGVNIPFQLGYTYEASFANLTSWSFADTTIYKKPFFNGAGFVGVKYLASPQNVGITVFSTPSRSGQFQDPASTVQLYRYLTGNLNAADGTCNIAGGSSNPQLLIAQTHMCFINVGGPQDMRFFQSSGPLTLAPGGEGTIAVAYVFAAPRAASPCTGPGVCQALKPDFPTGKLTRLSFADSIVLGVNTVDLMTGFDGFTGDANNDGLVQQGELAVGAHTLLGKALTAQSVFDAKFKAPAPPASPNFYLLPSDHQVTIVWQPSLTEDPANPDAFYGTAHRVGPAYDPNYRANDVAGYRIYRGTSTNPSTFTLLAQFDIKGDSMIDSTGQVNSNLTADFTNCAPSLGVFVTCPFVAFVVTDPNTGSGVNIVNDTTGQPRKVALSGPVVQVQGALLVDSLAAPAHALVTRADTAITAGTNFPSLSDNGVPFVFIDKAGTPGCAACGVSNNKTYYYVVTTFDLNSVGPGQRGQPSSLESSKTRFAPIVPSAPAPNTVSTSSIVSHVVDANGVERDTLIKALPTLDPTTGMFSGPMPPADNASVQFVGSFVTQLFQGVGPVGKATLKGLSLGDARNNIPVVFNWRIFSPDGLDSTDVSFSIQQAAPTDGSATNATASSQPVQVTLTPDPVLAAKFGIVGPLQPQNIQLQQGLFPYQVTNAQGRSCAADLIPPTNGSNCTYFGPRWFAGANETKTDPNGGNACCAGNATDLNNSGELPNVATILRPAAYVTVNSAWRQFDAVLGGAIRAADFNVYWNATNAGKIDSVMDVTHGVAVPFFPDSVGGGFGVLNQTATTATGSFDAQPGVLTVSDWGCVEPLRTIAGSQAAVPCTSAAPFLLSDSVQLGAVGLWVGNPANSQTVAAQPNPGFSIYIAGHIFMIEMATPTTPAPSNTVWTLRSYIGFITGGNGSQGNLGAYKFSSFPRTFSAIGASLLVSYDATNSTNATAAATGLANVHTVPDPYYVTSSYENSTDNKIIKFIHLPTQAIIRIYSSSGVLVDVLEHPGPKCAPPYVAAIAADECVWNVRNRNQQFVASGVYFWHVESGDARRVGRMTIVNFAK